MTTVPLTPQVRNAIAQQSNKVFADAEATSDQVLEAMIGYLTVNGVLFHTASGEIAVHLSNAVTALRAQRQNEESNTRRFLGQPKDTSIIGER